MWGDGKTLLVPSDFVPSYIYIWIFQPLDYVIFPVSQGSKILRSSDACKKVSMFVKICRECVYHSWIFFVIFWPMDGTSHMSDDRDIIRLWLTREDGLTECLNRSYEGMKSCCLTFSHTYTHIYTYIYGRNLRLLHWEGKARYLPKFAKNHLFNRIKERIMSPRSMLF